MLTKYKEYASDHPSLKSIQAVSFWGVGGDGIENVYKDKEQGYQQSHPALKKKTFLASNKSGFFIFT